MNGFPMMLMGHRGLIYIFKSLFGLRYYPWYEYFILSTVSWYL